MPTTLPTPWHALDATSVLERLGGDATAGLAAQAVAQRSAEHGPNALPEPPKRSGFMVFVRQFKSPLIYVLFIAAALAAGLGHVGDAAVILAVALVNALIGCYQEGRAERSMAALRRLSALQVRVLRDDQEQAIPARDLVPGERQLKPARETRLETGDVLVLFGSPDDLQRAERALLG